jgi:hypothetical protein
MFLLKTAFWLSLLILLIPVGKEISAAGQGEISKVEAISAARAVWNDFSTFCERNQQACETGNRLVARFGDKARSGARMIHEYLDENLGRNGADDAVTDSATR